MLLLAGTGGADSDRPRRSPSGAVRQMLVSGAAVTIPLFVTIIVLVFIVNFLLGAINPLVVIVNDTLGTSDEMPAYAPEIISVATLVAIVFVVGFVAETRSGSGLENAFDTAMARIPGIGSVYTSFNEMSELLLSNDTQSFQEVKLVEFPTQGTYTVAFVTAETPAAFEEATDNEEMITLFMPMAPNPVMGGYVIHIAREKVYDVDITVEEGIRSIVTSGVATGKSTDSEPPGELVDWTRIREQAREGLEDFGNWRRSAAGVDPRAVLDADDLDELKEQTRRELRKVRSENRDEGGEDGSEIQHYTLSEEVRGKPDETDGDHSTGGETDGDEPTGDRP